MIRTMISARNFCPGQLNSLQNAGNNTEIKPLRRAANYSGSTHSGAFTLHLKNPYKAHKYRLCRDLPFCSNSQSSFLHTLLSYVFPYILVSNISIFFYSISFLKLLVPASIFFTHDGSSGLQVINRYLQNNLRLPCSHS